MFTEICHVQHKNMLRKKNKNDVELIFSLHAHICGLEATNEYNKIKRLRIQNTILGGHF